MSQIEEDPHNFIRALQCINIPPDCMFTVRFGGETWHQFVPLTKNSPHPVFFALSCHTNELGGALSDELREKVLANEATIPSLTTLLPQAVMSLLEDPSILTRVATIDLALDAPPGTLQRAMCGGARGTAGRLLGAWGNWRGSRGFESTQASRARVVELEHTPEGSLLRAQLNDAPFHHEDTFSLTMDLAAFDQSTAPSLLSAVLDGFLSSPPSSVARMMAFRNLLVRPLGLRTSPLGCPVSSLLSPDRSKLFANRFPVLDQAIDEANSGAQVVLGANDKHLLFRSCVGVKLLDHSRVECTLGTRVRCKNLFGRAYMAAINRVHRAYVTPVMLSRAVEQAMSKGQQAVPASAQAA